MVKSRVKTKDIDRGYKKILKELRKLEKKPYVKIGYPARRPSTTNAKKEFRSGEGLATDRFVTVLDVAIGQEFGNSKTPERSFIRASFDARRRKYERINKKLIVKIYKGEMTVEKALDIIGLTIENDIKRFLFSGKVKPESLRAISDGGKTLVDTAQLANSITFVKVMSGKT